MTFLPHVRSIMFFAIDAVPLPDGVRTPAAEAPPSEEAMGPVPKDPHPCTAEPGSKDGDIPPRQHGHSPKQHGFRAIQSDGSAFHPEVLACDADLPAELAASPHAAAYRSRFAEGHLLIVVRENGVLMHHTWLADRALRIDELAVTAAIPAGECCAYDCFTTVRARGRGLYPIVLRWIATQLAPRKEWRRIHIYAEADNAASLRGIAKAGFMPAGTVRAFVMGRRVLFRWGRAALPSHTMEPL